jgi:hypothetical protein
MGHAEKQKPRYYPRPTRPQRRIVRVEALPMYGPRVYVGELECGHVARVWGHEASRKECRLCPTGDGDNEQR